MHTYILKSTNLTNIHNSSIHFSTPEKIFQRNLDVVTSSSVIFIARQGGTSTLSRNGVVFFFLKPAGSSSVMPTKRNHDCSLGIQSIPVSLHAFLLRRMNRSVFLGYSFSR